MSFFGLFKKGELVTKEVGFQLISTTKGNFVDFQKRLLTASNILLITGKRGSGKTALGMKFLDIFLANTKKRVYAMGFDSVKLPFSIKKAKDINDIRNDSAALVDEAALSFGSRDAMKSSNKQLGSLMAIARHKNLTLILIAQNSAMIDLNVLRLADTIILKEPSLLQAQFERKAIKEMYEQVGNHFKNIPDSKAHFYVMDDQFEGMLKFGLPNFWNERISKSFSNR